MLHLLKMFFSKSYAEKYKKMSKLNMIGFGEVNWQLKETNGNVTPKLFTVHFYENELEERTYNVIGPKNEVAYYWPLTKSFHDAEMWKSSGIRPSWFQDILIKKLSQ